MSTPRKCVRRVWRFIRFLSGNCDVCGGRKVVTACRPGARVGAVIPCPHCQDPRQLWARVACERMPSPGGAA